MVARWYDLSGGGAGQTVTDSLRQREDESLEDLLLRGTESIAGAINESWKRANLISFDQQQSIVAEVPLDSLQRWQQVRSSLQSVSMINGVQLRLLNRRAALVEVSFLGAVDQLQLALSQRDLRLSEDRAGGVWRIAAAGYAPPAAPSSQPAPAEYGIENDSTGSDAGESEAE